MNKIDNINIDGQKLKKLTTVAGVITLVVVGFYVTGFYRNILQIKKLKDEERNSLSSSEY